MAGKSGDLTNRAVTLASNAAAVFIARKVITFAWKKVTGKEPPEHPEDPEVALGEAAAWALLVGTVAGMTRLLVTRVTARRQHDSDAELPEVAERTGGR